MTEKNKLILLRLLVVPYFILAFINTLFFGIVFAIGFLLLGLPSYILKGRTDAWIPDWNMDWVLTIDEYERFKDDLKERQRELDRH